MESAITDINTIREKRIENDYEITATNREDALNKVWEERRRELCFEKHRWFDLRRQGMPELRHIFTNGEVGKNTFYPREVNPTRYRSLKRSESKIRLS